MSQSNGAHGREHRVYFKNAQIIDGTGEEPFLGGLLVEGDHIREVGRFAAEPDRPDVEVIDLGGRTLMPGMVLAHVHLGHNQIREQADLDLRRPPEVATIAAVVNARTMLDCGFTAGISAGALHQVDIHIRDAIDAGKIPGPRLLAAGRDIYQTGGMLDWNPNWLRLGMEGLGLRADGPWEVRKAVRQLVQEGADVLRMYVTGEGLVLPNPQIETTCTNDEIEAFVEEAHRRQRLCAVQARTAESCRRAARAGVDIIDGATGVDDETLDLLAESEAFIVPGLDHLVSTLDHARQGGFPGLGSYNNFLDRTHSEEELDAALENIAEMYHRGLNVLMGGDFGFCWCPHGTYARELTHLVKLVGYKPMDALVAATRLGARAMRMDDQIGTLQPGKRADLLVIEGNPLHDISLLEDRGNISCVMKDGQFFRRSVVEPALALV